MKILVVTNMWPTDTTPWLGTFVKKQVESLKELDLDIDVYNIKSKKSNGTNLNYLKAVFFIFFKIIFKRYNIIHNHHWICWVITFPFFWLEKVYTVHEGEFFLGGYRRFFINLAIKYSDKVIFVNKLMYDKYFISSTKSKRFSKFYFIPSGVEHNVFCGVDIAKAKSELNLSLDKTYIFFPALPERLEKNASFLKLWFEKFNDNPKLHIIWGGSVSYENMPLLFSACHCTLTLGDYESDGMVVKESLATGTPVISFDVGNSRLYIESDICGFVIRRDFKELDDAIKKLVSREKITKNLLDQQYFLSNVAISIFNVYFSKMQDNL